MKPIARLEPPSNIAANLYSVEAEESTVGGVLVHGQRFEDISFLSTNEYYLPAPRALFEAMRHVAADGKPIDRVTVIEQMRSLGTLDQLEAVDGLDYLDYLMGRVVTVASLAYHANIIREKASKRQAVAVVQQGKRALDDGADPRDVLEGLVARGLEIIEEKKAASAPPLFSVSEILRSESFKRARRTLETNIPGFNALVGGGLKTRQQSIWVAPTGTGKTGLAGTMMHSFGLAGRPVYWLATELDAEEQAARFAALALRHSGTNATPDMLLTHELPPEHAAIASDGLPIYIRRWRRHLGDPFIMVRTDGQNIVKRHGEPPVIVVDYLQKLAAADEERRRVSVSNVSEELLELAQDLDTHVMAISSVSRALYNAAARKARKAAEDEDPRDWLAVGKESGDLEYDAAIVVYLDVADEKSLLNERNARLIVAKARGGDVGFVGLRFHGPSGLFVPDDAAAATLRPEARKSNKPDVVEALLAHLKQHQVDPPTATRVEIDLKGFGATLIRNAIKVAIADGRVEERPVTLTNSRGAKRTHNVLILAKAEES